MNNCKPLCIIGLTLCLISGFFSTVYSSPMVTLPIRFHIVSGLIMTKNGQTMDSWVTAGDITKTLVPEINRIWQIAEITFTVEKILLNPVLFPPKQKALIEYIVNAERDDNGKSDDKRIKKLNKIFDWRSHNPDAINVYLVPYLGQASQGNAKPNMKRVFVGQWSDKPTKGQKPPEKFPLTKSVPFRQGSLSRTIAHEIGHILGLKHPDKSTQKTFHLLMGGKHPGYQLTLEEIDIARLHAASFNNN